MANGFGHNRRGNVTKLGRHVLQGLPEPRCKEVMHSVIRRRGRLSPVIIEINDPRCAVNNRIISHEPQLTLCREAAAFLVPLVGLKDHPGGLLIVQRSTEPPGVFANTVQALAQMGISPRFRYRIYINTSVRLTFLGNVARLINRICYARA